MSKNDYLSHLRIWLDYVIYCFFGNSIELLLQQHAVLGNTSNPNPLKKVKGFCTLKNCTYVTKSKQK